jgi:predicted phage terminase large subunit-like protein
VTISFAPASRKQQMMLTSNADVTIVGGAAGSGKSYISILRHLRFIDDPYYRGNIIRKDATILSRQGGMFDECLIVFKAFEPRVKYTKQPMVFTFPSGATVSLTHYNDDKASEQYRGLQLQGICYDELTEAKENHIFTLISRMRAVRSKYKEWFLGTCNPHVDSWLKDWVLWYLYPEGHELAGRPDPNKDGIIRYINNLGGKTVFTNTKDEMKALVKDFTGREPQDHEILSFTFVSANIYDNPPLLKNAPQYLSKLLAQPRVEQERLLHGNWFARQEASGRFKREWLGEPLPEAKRTDIKSRVRCWDLAGSLPDEVNPNPDWTVGVLMSKDKHGVFYIEDVVRFRERVGQVIERIAQVALADQEEFGNVQVYLPQEPAQAGISALKYNVSVLASYGIGARGIKVGSKSKTTRFEPFCASAEVGNIRIVKGEWNDVFFEELESFDGSRNRKDDIVDSTADSFSRLAERKELPKFSLDNSHFSNPLLSR